MLKSRIFSPFLTTIISLGCCGKLNITVMVENMLDEETSGEYERLQTPVRGRTAYLRRIPEKIYLVYNVNAWKISRDPLFNKNDDQVIKLEGEAYSCLENENDGGKYSIQTETSKKNINIMCLGKNRPFFLVEINSISALSFSSFM